MTVDESRTLPYSLEAERSVLGCVLLENERFDEVADLLAADDFFRDAHRRTFEAIKALRARRCGVDDVTLKEELARRGDLEEVGGPVYVASLADGMPRGVNLTHYAQIVLQKAQRRRLIAALNKGLSAAYDGEQPFEEVIEATEAGVLSVGQQTTGADFVFGPAWVSETFTHIERLAKNPQAITGVRSGFRELDELTRGFQPGDLIIIGARPSMGKTALAVQMALHAAQAGMVGVFSIEMARLALGIRAFALTGRINGMRLMTGRLKSDDYARLVDARGKLDRLRIAIDDSAMLTPTQLRTKARRLRSQQGLSALFVDYLQIVEPGSQDRRRSENRTLELGVMSRNLKQLAKELQVPVIVLSQLSRDAEKRAGDGRPKLSDLRESGAIEQDADVVLLLHRPEYYQHPPEPKSEGLAEIIIAKQRNGPVGVVELLFSKEFTRFDDWSHARAEGK